MLRTRKYHGPFMRILAYRVLMRMGLPAPEWLQGTMLTLWVDRPSIQEPVLHRCYITGGYNGERKSRRTK